MSVLVVVCVGLLLALVLGALFSLPWGLASGGGEPIAVLPPESTDARGRLAALVLPPSAIVGELPSLAERKHLQAVLPIEPPSVDLSTIGCGEDKGEADAAVWREVQRALAQRSGKTPSSGER